MRPILLGLLCLAGILACSLMPFKAKAALHITANHPALHSIAHIAAFATLALIACRRATLSSIPPAAALASVAALGVADEFLENFVYHQGLEPADMLLNILGATAGTALTVTARALSNRVQKNARN